MRSLFFITCVAALLGFRSHEADGTHTPSLETVITLLNTMISTFTANQAQDQTNWDTYDKFSEDTIKDRNTFIQTQEGVILTQTSQLNSNKQLETTLDGQLTTIAGEIAETKKGLKKLLDLRTEENRIYQETEADLTNTATSVSNAIGVLQGHYAAGVATMTLGQVRQEVAQALSMVAVSHVAQDPKYAGLTQVLQAPSNWLNKDGDDYSTYTGQEGGSVIQTLQTIHATLLKDKQDGITKENAARTQYETAKGLKDNELKASEDEQGTKTTAKNEANAKVTQATSSISQAEIDKAAAEKEVGLLEAEHTAFLNMFNDRTTRRSKEKTATQAALDTLTDISLGAKTTVSTLVQMQFRHAVNHHLETAVKQLAKVAKFAKDDNHDMLMHAVLMLQAKTGPTAFFDPKTLDPIKTMLQKLVTRLEDEASAESTHKEWCATERKTTTEGKTLREGKIVSLTSEIGTLNTTINSLTGEIDFYGGELTRIQDETTEAGRIRTEQNTAYLGVKKDHDEVIDALDSAIQSMQTEYTLLQDKAQVKHFMAIKANAHTTQGPAGTDVPFGEYTAGKGGDVVTMLQDLLNKYSTARTAATDNENKAKGAYDNLVKENNKFRDDAQTTLTSKENQKTAAETRLDEAEGELSQAETEVAAAETYLNDLKPACDDIRMSFEERTARRKAEIDALKECLEALNDPSVLR